MRGRKLREGVGLTFLNIFFIALCFVTLIPILYALSVSLNGQNALLSSDFSFLPKDFTLDNYLAVFTGEDILTWFGNSVILAAATVAISLAAAVPADWSPLETYFAITVTLSLLSWTGLARVVRGKILSLREEDYAVAARLLGAGHGRILFRHLLPAFASHIIVTLTLTVPGMILGETSLSFLGLGLRPPVVSWGVMLQECMNVKAVIDYPWLLSPVLMLVFAVLCFNFVGDGLRDAADPYASK